MKNSILSAYTVLLFVIATHSWLLSELNETSLSGWEIVASTIINRYSHLIYDIQIVCEKACLSDKFLQSLWFPIQLTNSRLHERSFLFLVPQTQSFVSSVLNSAANATKSKYVIFLDCEECATVTWILDQCWQHRLLNVLVIPVENGIFPIYTYFPFGEGKCFDPSPVSIDKFTDAFLSGAELFPKWKARNLQKCPLNVSTFTLYPAIYFDNLEIKGWLSPVFKALAHHMNFRPQFIHIEGKEWSGGVSGPNKTGIRGDVFTEAAQLGFLLLQPIDFKYLDYDSLAMTGCVTWCLPATLRNKSIWWPIIGEFEPFVWLVLIVSVLGMVAADYMSRQKAHRICSNGEDVMYMSVVAALLQASERAPRYPSAFFRFLWMCWLIASLVLSTAYVSALKSFLTAPYIEVLVRNLDDLAEAGFEAWYEEGLADMVDDAIETNPAVRRLKSKSVLYPPEMTSSMFDRFQYKNITSLMMDKQCSLASEWYGDNVTLYPVPEACMQTTSLHCFVMRRKSVYTEAVKLLMGRMTQAGIVQKCFSNSLSLSRSADIKGRSITLKNVFPALVLLVSGLTVSFVAFFLEWLCKKVF